MQDMLKEPQIPPDMLRPRPLDPQRCVQQLRSSDETDVSSHLRCFAVSFVFVFGCLSPARPRRLSTFLWQLPLLHTVGLHLLKFVDVFINIHDFDQTSPNGKPTRPSLLAAKVEVMNSTLTLTHEICNVTGNSSGNAVTQV